MRHRTVQESTTAEEILGTALNYGSLVRMDMLRVGGEAPGFGPGMDGDLFHLRVENPHQPGLGQLWI